MHSLLLFTLMLPLTLSYASIDLVVVPSNFTSNESSISSRSIGYILELWKYKMQLLWRLGCRPLLDLRVSVTGGVHFDLVKRVLRDIKRSGQAPEEIIQQVRILALWHY